MRITDSYLWFRRTINFTNNSATTGGNTVPTGSVVGFACFEVIILRGHLSLVNTWYAVYPRRAFYFRSILLLDKRTGVSTAAEGSA